MNKIEPRHWLDGLNKSILALPASKSVLPKKLSLPVCVISKPPLFALSFPLNEPIPKSSLPLLCNKVSLATFTVPKVKLPALVRLNLPEVLTSNLSPNALSELVRLMLPDGVVSLLAPVTFKEPVCVKSPRVTVAANWPVKVDSPNCKPLADWIVALMAFNDSDCAN